jgi:hypothetical protein
MVDTCLFLTCMTTTPAGINVNVNRHNPRMVFSEA